MIMGGTVLRVLAAIVLACELVGAGQAAAEPFAAPSAPAGSVPWHRDLAQAKAASLISHRPVLIIFTAEWSEAAKNLDKEVFSTEEASALLTACFEPVRVDVDADPVTARSKGVSHLPSACVVDAEERVLATFDCPPTSAAFVAAAGRAAQDAAIAQTSGRAAPAAGEQSAFAAQSAATNPAAQTPAAAPQAPTTAAAPEPALPPSPPTWPPTPPVAANALATEPPVAAAARPSLDPAPTQAQASGQRSAPWLNAADTSTAPTAPTAPAAPAAPAAPTAGTVVAQTQPGTPQAPATTAAPEKKSATDSFFSALQKPFSIFSRPKTPADEAKTPSTGATATSTPSAQQPAAATDPFGSMPLGLEGYCPVSLVDKGTWVEGRAQWGARHRGRTYLFAGVEQQKAFLADPDRYAPALSGDDPVLACDTGKQVAGQRRYGVTYQARMYLFSSPETRSTFAANPQRYTSRVLVAEQPPAGNSVVR